jgi:hypothetical protein
MQPPEILSAFSRGDGIESRETLLNLGTLAMRTDDFLLSGLSQGQDLRKRLVARQA